MEKRFAVVVWRDTTPTNGWYHETDVVRWYARERDACRFAEPRYFVVRDRWWIREAS